MQYYNQMFLVLEENVPYFMKSGVCIRSSRKGEKEIKLQEKIKTKQSWKYELDKECL